MLTSDKAGIFMVIDENSRSTPTVPFLITGSVGVKLDALG